MDSQTVKTTGVRGKERGFDPAKKVQGRKRHLLVDTEGLVLKAKVHSAKVPDQDGLRLLLESARAGLSRLKHLWVDAGYQGRGKKWAEEVLGLSVEVVRKPQKPVPEKLAKLWAQQWAKEGKEVNWQRLMPPKGFQVLPRRWEGLHRHLALSMLAYSFLMLHSSITTSVGGCCSSEGFFPLDQAHDASGDPQAGTGVAFGGPGAMVHRNREDQDLPSS